jgi:hypothetical protein
MLIRWGARVPSFLSVDALVVTMGFPFPLKQEHSRVEIPSFPDVGRRRRFAVVVVGLPVTGPSTAWMHLGLSSDDTSVSSVHISQTRVSDILV